MSASPVLIDRSRDNVSPQVIEAFMALVRERAIGTFEIHFNAGVMCDVVVKKILTSKQKFTGDSQAEDFVPQKVINGYMSFVREKASGVLEIQFKPDGIGHVIAKKSELYK